MKSKDWLQRHKKDIYVKKANKEEYLTRSAFKLIEIEKKFRIVSNSKQILELGSSPGGWSQVICNINKKAKIHAFDLLEMKFSHKNINFFRQDFLKYDFQSFNNRYDLILSDVAPNTTGHQSTDHLKISSIILDIISILKFIALQNSSFVFKIWKGSEENNILNKLKKQYKKVSYYKPNSSRKESSEIFIVAENFIV
jgi:23S rRNA (uridine2552-2'-O)-methyltransferase